MKSLAILGASGHGKVIAETAHLSGWTEIIFFDDAYPQCQFLENWKISGPAILFNR